MNPSPCFQTLNIHGLPLAEFFVCGVTDDDDHHLDASGNRTFEDGDVENVLRPDCRKDPATCLHHVEMRFVQQTCAIPLLGAGMAPDRQLTMDDLMGR